MSANAVRWGPGRSHSILGPPRAVRYVQERVEFRETSANVYVRMRGQHCPMETHQKGDLTEAIVIAELKRRELPVSRPVGDNERYDLIVESETGLWKLQVKTGWLTDWTIEFRGYSQHTNAQGNMSKPYDGDVDYFLVYCDELERMYLVEESASGSNMRLRVEEPEKQDRTINWAEEYEFDRNWPPEDGTCGPTNTHAPIATKLEDNGVPTYLPVDTSTAYDAIAETPNGEVHRLQFQLGWVVDGRVRFESGHSNGRHSGKASVDYILMFCAELDQLYIVARDSFDSTISFRIEEPKKRDCRINWAEDHEFEDNWPP